MTLVSKLLLKPLLSNYPTVYILWIANSSEGAHTSLCPQLLHCFVCVQLEATVLSHSEPSPELEKKVKSMAMNKLKMERLIAKLYSVSCCTSPWGLCHRMLSY